MSNIDSWPLANGFSARLTKRQARGIRQAQNAQGRRKGGGTRQACSSSSLPGGRHLNGATSSNGAQRLPEFGCSPIPTR